MGMIPDVKCRRCGETFSSLRSRCPNCGTRRVTQSGRSPAPTPGSVKGTAAYDRSETNTRWQMIFGLILVVAVILAVIVMVTTTLNNADTVQSKVTPPVLVTDTPLIEEAPTPSPTPTPTIDSITIKHFENTLDDITVKDTDEPLTLTAVPFPLSIEGIRVTWSTDDEAAISLVPADDTLTCELRFVGGTNGTYHVTAECFGVETTIIIRGVVA